jgi:hypothetical protein
MVLLLQIVVCTNSINFFAAVVTCSLNVTTYSEIPGSNLGKDTGYHNEGFRDFLLSLHAYTEDSDGILQSQFHRMIYKLYRRRPYV